MVLFKGKIKEISATENKGFSLYEIVSDDENITLNVEIPDSINIFNKDENVSVNLSSTSIKDNDKNQILMKGRIYEVKEEDKIQTVYASFWGFLAEASIKGKKTTFTPKKDLYLQIKHV